MRVKKNNLWKHLVYLLLLFLTIGFAYLSTNLSINGTANFKGNTWDIHFANVLVSSDSVTADQPTLTNGATELSFNVNLQKPGDKYEFTVDVVNAGTIDAMIDTINRTTLTGEAANYAELSFTYANGREIKKRDLLEYNSSKTIKVIVSFKENIDEEDLPSTDKGIDVELEIEYVQADEAAVSTLGTYYEFGEPTPSSPTDFRELNSLIFISLKGEQKSVCILDNNEPACFRENNPDVEKLHVESVFGRNWCHYDSTNKRYDCINYSRMCRIYDNGKVECGHNDDYGITDAICSLVDNVAECDILE